jgi:hypothetical protein
MAMSTERLKDPIVSMTRVDHLACHDGARRQVPEGRGSARCRDCASRRRRAIDVGGQVTWSCIELQAPPDMPSLTLPGMVAVVPGQ